MTTLQLVNAMNELEVTSFVSRRLSRNGKQMTNVSALAEDGKRHWLNRVRTGQGADGTAKYGWALGNELAPRQEAPIAE